ARLVDLLVRKPHHRLSSSAERTHQRQSVPVTKVAEHPPVRGASRRELVLARNVVRTRYDKRRSIADRGQKMNGHSPGSGARRQRVESLYRKGTTRKWWQTHIAAKDQVVTDSHAWYL